MQYHLFNKNFFKLILLSGIVCTLLCVGINSSQAAVTDGKSYTSYTFSEVPAWGGTKYNTTKGSKKSDTESYGTFKTVNCKILIAPYCRFMSSSKTNKSPARAVPYGVAKHSLYTSVKKGDVLYTKVSSSSVEPGKITVTLYHSANNLLK